MSDRRMHIPIPKRGQPWPYGTEIYHPFGPRCPSTLRPIVPLPRTALLPDFHGKYFHYKDREQHINFMFNRYVTPASPHVMGPGGIATLFSHLNVEDTEAKILRLAWKLCAKRRGYFTRVEWQNGLSLMMTDDVVQLKRALELTIPEEIRLNLESFCWYAYRYYLTDNQRGTHLFWSPTNDVFSEHLKGTLSIKTACQLLRLVFREIYPDQAAMFTRYLCNQKVFKVLHFSEWLDFLRFCKKIPFPSLENYEPLEFPAILDSAIYKIGHHANIHPPE